MSICKFFLNIKVGLNQIQFKIIKSLINKYKELVELMLRKSNNIILL